jgi:hypothetical protein
LAFQVEGNFSHFPLVAGFGGEGADQAQQESIVREDAGHAGASFEFHIDPFERIVGASAVLMGERLPSGRKPNPASKHNPSGQRS